MTSHIDRTDFITILCSSFMLRSYLQFISTSIFKKMCMVEITGYIVKVIISESISSKKKLVKIM